jgi:fused signal recognition particle receptor
MKSVFKIFHKGLRKTAVSFSRKLGECLAGTKEWNDETYDALEAALIGSDFGVPATMRIVDNLRERYESGRIKTGEDIISAAKHEITAILNKSSRDFDFQSESLTVILLVGVNGCGKTTTAGKLAHLLKKEDGKVMLAACDTFRAAAIEQLNLWGKKIDSYVVSARHGADPSSVAFDAVKAAISKKYNYLIIDTAGRQHTKKGLMDELAKMNRSIAKAYPSAPQETWLVVDGSIGANALSQAREFSKTSRLNGFVCTKLDGTGKGGMVVAIKDEFDLPVFFLGLGEQAEDLQVFNPSMFVDALFEELEHPSGK